MRIKIIITIKIINSIIIIMIIILATIIIPTLIIIIITIIIVVINRVERKLTFQAPLDGHFASVRGDEH